MYLGIIETTTVCDQVPKYHSGYLERDTVKTLTNNSNNNNNNNNKSNNHNCNHNDSLEDSTYPH